MRSLRSDPRSLVIFFLLASLSLAQSQAVVKHNVKLRSDPSTDQPAIRTLVPPEALILMDPDPANGYYHVQTTEGEDGWVWGRNIDIQSAPTPTPGPAPAPTPGTAADSIATDWDKPDPQDSMFHGAEGDCGETGDGGDSDTNARKNRIDVPSSYHLVKWSAINGLAYPAGAPKSRQNWTANQFAKIRPFEGSAVTVEGYLYKVKVESSSPSRRGGESTNCHAHLADDVDWHMPVTANAHDGEDVAIIVETTPRIRTQHPNWTVNRLKPWTFMLSSSRENANYNGQPVRISGWLMLDPEHQDMIDHGQRSTLWEIHPITKIEVLQDGRWTDLDDVR